MTFDSCEKEVLAIQARFNRTFGEQKICNLKARQEVLLAIIQMGRLCKQISKTSMIDETEDLKLRLLKMRDTLNIIFDKIEQSRKERRALNHEKKFPYSPAAPETRSMQCDQRVPAMQK